MPDGATVEVRGPIVQIVSGDLVRASHAVTSWAVDRGFDLDDFRVERPSLEDTYLAIIGASSRPPVAEEAKS
jgi:hypothetical protein